MGDDRPYAQQVHLLSLDAKLMSYWLTGVDTQFTYPFHGHGDDHDSAVDSLSSSGCLYSDKSNDNGNKRTRVMQRYLMRKNQLTRE